MSRRIDRLGGLIAAAGLSSRMGAFKPMLPLGGVPLIWRTVHTLKDCGMTRIVVVAGREAQALEELLTPRGITVIVNPRYAQSQMLDSIRLGLAALGDTDGVFFLPGDVPLTAPHTVRLLLEEALAGDCAVAYPLYHGRRGHPPLIDRRCYEGIWHYRGAQGLKGALAGWEAREVPTPDAGCLLDADTPEDYQRLCQYEQGWRYPDTAACLDILGWAGTPPQVIAHGQAVAALADELAAQLVRAGEAICPDLVHSGALLHDVLRTEPEHALAGAALLAEMGRCAVAAVIREHMALSAEAAELLDERAVVFLADKLVRETQRVTLAERYAPALRRFAADTVVGAQIRGQLGTAMALQERVKRMTGLLI